MREGKGNRNSVSLAHTVSVALSRRFVVWVQERGALWSRRIKDQAETVRGG